MKTNAREQLTYELDICETIEAIVFGNFGESYDEGEVGYNESNPPPVPFDMRGRPLTPEEALPLMESWSFEGEYGAPMTYATYIWTDKRIIFVTQNNGITMLDSVPRYPCVCKPHMSGG